MYIIIGNSEVANKPAKTPPINRGESTAAMEPMLVRADSSKLHAPLNLVIPAELAACWMPGLFPEQAST